MWLYLTRQGQLNTAAAGALRSWEHRVAAAIPLVFAAAGSAFRGGPFRSVLGRTMVL